MINKSKLDGLCVCVPTSEATVNLRISLSWQRRPHSAPSHLCWRSSPLEVPLKHISCCSTGYETVGLGQFEDSVTWAAKSGRRFFCCSSGVMGEFRKSDFSVLASVKKKKAFRSSVQATNSTPPPPQLVFWCDPTTEWDRSCSGPSPI